MPKLYYTPPTDEQFEECKKACINLWPIVDSDNDKYGYATGKISQIKDIKNIQDNFMYMVAMFDHINQKKLSDNLSSETRKAISDRIIDGGGELNPFHPDYIERSMEEIMSGIFN